MKLPLFAILAFVSLAYACEKAALQPVDHMILQSTPASSRIVNTDTIHTGWFNEPFENTDIKTGRCSHPLRRKQWQYISFTSAAYIVGLSTINVGYLSNCFVYCFNIRTKTFVDFEDLALGGGRSHIAANSLTGTSSYSSKNCSISIENHYREGFYIVRINCTGKNSTSLTGSVKVNVVGDPMVNIREIAPKRLVYTHQSTAYRPEGSLVSNGDTIRFNPATDFAGFDYTQGRHQYKTNWNWAAASGVATDSSPVSICFSSGTGVFYWINGKMHRVESVNFSYPDVDSLWRITSPDSTISLRFQPFGKRTGKVSILGLIKSNFYQPFGTFSGTIRATGREPVKIETLYGVTEEHEARW